MPQSLQSVREQETPNVAAPVDICRNQAKVSTLAQRVHFSAHIEVLGG